MLLTTASGFNDYFNISMQAEGECNSTRAKAKTTGTIYDGYYYLPDDDSYGYVEAILHWNGGGNSDVKNITDTSTTPYAKAAVAVTRLKSGASGFYSTHYAYAKKDGVIQNSELVTLDNSEYGY